MRYAEYVWIIDLKNAKYTKSKQLVNKERYEHGTFPD